MDSKSTTSKPPKHPKLSKSAKSSTSPTRAPRAPKASKTINSTKARGRPRKLPILQPAGHGHTAAWVTALADPKLDEDDPEVSNASILTPPDEGISKRQLLQMMESELLDLKDKQKEVELDIAGLKTDLYSQPTPHNHSEPEPKPTSSVLEAATIPLHSPGPGQSSISIQVSLDNQNQSHFQEGFMSDPGNFLVPPHIPFTPLPLLPLRPTGQDITLWDPTSGLLGPEDFLNAACLPPVQAIQFDSHLPAFADPKMIDERMEQEKVDPLTDPVKRSFEEFMCMEPDGGDVTETKCQLPKAPKSLNQTSKKRRAKARRSTVA